MKSARFPRPLQSTKITGAGKIQLVKKAAEVLERQGHKVAPGMSVMYYETEDGELLLRIV